MCNKIGRRGDRGLVASGDTKLLLILISMVPNSQSKIFQLSQASVPRDYNPVVPFCSLSLRSKWAQGRLVKTFAASKTI